MWVGIIRWRFTYQESKIGSQKLRNALRILAILDLSMVGSYKSILCYLFEVFVIVTPCTLDHP
jgi:hypothetical protein